jgi:hypothetical protein
MDAAFVIKAAVVVVAFGLWIYHKSGEGAAPVASGPMAAPPPVPRRVRRARAAPGALAKEDAADAGGSVVTPARPPDATGLRVTRPAVARVRAEFRGVAALRRAVIAREVLGPPLSLRPPRR